MTASSHKMRMQALEIAGEIRAKMEYPEAYRDFLIARAKRLLDLLERGYPVLEGPAVEGTGSVLDAAFKPTELLDFASLCYDPPRWAEGAKGVKQRAQSLWQKHFRAWAPKAPEDAFEKALDQRIMMPFIPSFLQTFVLETADLDVELANRYVEILMVKTAGEQDQMIKNLQADIAQKTGEAPRRSRSPTPDAAVQAKRLEAYYAALPQSPETRTAEQRESALRDVFAIGRAMKRESGHDYLAAGLWADLFDSCVVDNRDGAIALAIGMLADAPPGGALARQIAASLLGVRDPQQTPSLPSPSGGAPLPLFKTRTLG